MAGSAWGQRSWVTADTANSPPPLRFVVQEQEKEVVQKDRGQGSQFNPRSGKSHSLSEPWYPGKVNRNRKKQQTQQSGDTVVKDGQGTSGSERPGCAQREHSFTASLREGSSQQNPWEQFKTDCGQGMGLQPEKVSERTWNKVCKEQGAPFSDSKAKMFLQSTTSRKNKQGISVTNLHQEELKKRGYASFEEWAEDPNHVYIGRDMSWAVPGAVGSKWKNPFKKKDDERQNRCTKYEEYILDDTNLYNGKTLLESLEELKGKELGCWCHPETCHGHVLKSLVEKYCP